MKKNKLLHHIRVQYIFVALIILLLGIKFEFCRLYFVSVSMPDILLSPLAGISGFIIVYLISLKYSGPFLDYLGQISLTIMCVHLFALETMGVYFNQFLDVIDVTGIVRVVCGDIIQVLFAVIGAVIVEIAKKRFVNYRGEPVINQINEIVDRNARDSSIDVAKGMLVISIFVGLFAIDEQLKTIFFSCNMIAFIFFSGYFYDSERSAKDSLLRMTKALIAPYLVVVAIVLLQSCRNWNVDFFVATAIKYGLGLSFSKELFSEIETVGPIYFLLFLFVVRLLYLLIDHFKMSELAKWITVVLLSLIGVVCGIQGYWLPWSIDIACYAIIFYKVGIAVRRYNVLSKLNHSKYFYFVLSPLWAYMIYSGSMVIAMRNYGSYGLAVLGSITGVMVVWLLAKYISDNLFIIKHIFIGVGRASIYILIVYTVLGRWINNVLSLEFNTEGMPYFLFSMLIQIIVAVFAYALVGYLKNRLNQ